MNMAGPRTLAKVLSAWGHHEAASGKPGADLLLPPVSLGHLGDGIEAILRHAPQLIARILLAEPVAVLEVEFEPEDGSKFLPCNGFGRTVAAAAEQWRFEESCSGKTVRTHVAAGVPVTGSFICTRRMGNGALVVYEGTHRMAAWLIHASQGLSYRISAHVIKTNGLDPFGPEVSNMKGAQ
jgi:hypothetical protein